MFTTVLIIFICLLSEGFFSGSEIALISANKIKIHEEAKKGHWLPRLIQEMFSKPDHLLGTTLVGTNVSAVISSVVMTSYFVSKYGEEGTFYSIIVMAPLILIFGEIIPKILFQRNADIISYVVIVPIKIMSFLFFPLVSCMTKASNFVLRIFSKERIGNNLFIKKDELKLMVEREKSNVDLNSAEREMIRKIFNFGDITVTEVMKPLVELVAVEVNSSVDLLVNKLEREEYSRIPIFEGRIYNIIGIVNTFDLLFLSTDKRDIKISDFMRPVYYVPQSKRVDDLLNELQSSGGHIAIVVNEYGGSVGLVTIEDILEEIVGEIQDEYDLEQKLYEKIDENTYLVEARMEVDLINEELNLNIPKGNYETLAGCILEKLEKIPKKGDIISSESLIFSIEKADEKSIKQVCIKIKKESV